MPMSSIRPVEGNRDKEVSALKSAAMAVVPRPLPALRRSDEMFMIVSAFVGSLSRFTLSIFFGSRIVRLALADVFSVQVCGSVRSVYFLQLSFFSLQDK